MGQVGDLATLGLGGEIPGVSVGPSEYVTYGELR